MQEANARASAAETIAHWALTALQVSAGRGSSQPQTDSSTESASDRVLLLGAERRKRGLELKQKLSTAQARHLLQTLLSAMDRGQASVAWGSKALHLPPVRRVRMRIRAVREKKGEEEWEIRLRFRSKQSAGRRDADGIKP